MSNSLADVFLSEVGSLSRSDKRVNHSAINNCVKRRQVGRQSLLNQRSN